MTHSTFRSSVIDKTDPFSIGSFNYIRLNELSLTHHSRPVSLWQICLIDSSHIVWLIKQMLYSFVKSILMSYISPIPFYFTVSRHVDVTGCISFPSSPVNVHLLTPFPHFNFRNQRILWHFVTVWTDNVSFVQLIAFVGNVSISLV